MKHENYKTYFIEIAERSGVWWAWVSDYQMRHQETFSASSEDEAEQQARAWIDEQDET